MSYALASQIKVGDEGNKASILTKRSYHEGGANILTDTPQKSVIHLQQTIGNQVVQRLIRSNARNNGTKTSIQTKLKISQPGDMYEQEV